MIRALSLFSGIGAFERALENLGIPFDVVAYSEIDRFASKSYSLLHNVPEERNLGDITKIDETILPQDIDACFYDFPCQDISIAGLKKGFIDETGNQTRSGLFFDALRIIRRTRPKIAIAENVKNLTSKKMKPVFDLILSSLDEAGYNCYWKLMDGEDYSMPQHRERVLIVAIRKDIDDGRFVFPLPVTLWGSMNDYLDDDVPESYYLSEEKTKSVIRHNAAHPGHLCDRYGVCPTLLARDYKDPKVVID